MESLRRNIYKVLQRRNKLIGTEDDPSFSDRQCTDEVIREVLIYINNNKEGLLNENYS